MSHAPRYLMPVFKTAYIDWDSSLEKLNRYNNAVMFIEHHNDNAAYQRKYWLLRNFDGIRVEKTGTRLFISLDT